MMIMLIMMIRIPLTCCVSALGWSPLRPRLCGRFLLGCLHELPLVLRCLACPAFVWQHVKNWWINLNFEVLKIVKDIQLKPMSKLPSIVVGTYNDNAPLAPVDNATTVAPSLLTHGSSVLRSILVSHRDPELQDDDARV